MKKFREYIEKFIMSCKKSKKQAAINILCSIVCLALSIVVVGLAIYASYKLSLWMLGIIFFLWLFAPGILDSISANMNTVPQVQVPCVYPVYFGWRDGRMIPALIDEIFSEIYSLFRSCYYKAFREKQNHVFYIFKVIPRQDMPINYDFHILLQSMAEKILAAFLMEWDISAPCGNMVAVKIAKDTLYIAFAKNDAGIHEIISYQNKLYEKFHQSFAPDNTDFSESWRDEKNE